MANTPLLPTQQSQLSYCYHSFLQHHIAMLVFQILLAQSCLLVPCHSVECDWIMVTVQRAVNNRRLTNFEITALIRDYEEGLWSHAFMDVDSEGIFNAVMAFVNQ
jgi:hypothetical protein